MPLEEKLPVIQPSKAMCLYKGCESFAYFDKCYMHTYCLCPVFIKFYNELNEEDKTALLHPDQLYLGD